MRSWKRVEHIHHDRSNVNLELGVFLTRNWNVSAFGAWQQTHGGIDLPIPRSHPLFPNHDRIGDDEYFNVGLGMGYSLTEKWSGFVTYMQGVNGAQRPQAQPGSDARIRLRLPAARRVRRG